MKKTLALLASATLIFGCRSSQETKTSKDPIILTVGEDQTSTLEFDHIYKKNNSRDTNAYSQQSLEQYMELYTNFRLKVLEAESLGYDTATSFKKELDGYRYQLAKSFLTEDSVIENLTKEAYEHMEQVVNASHILVQVSELADPKDTAAAYQKISEIRERVVNGMPFDEAARKFSEGPSGQFGGELGYFGAFKMVYSFEKAAFDTPVGEVSQPFRSQFGYHILKVDKKVQSAGEVELAHIYIGSRPGVSPEDSLAAAKKIQDIHKALQEGKAWNELCAQFSEDPSSRQNGGALKPFYCGTSRYPSVFEEAALNLQTPGNYTDPIQSIYGWHIIKLVGEKKPLPSYEEMHKELKQKVSRLPRAHLSEVELYKRLKREDSFQESEEAFAKALTYTNETLPKGQWTVNLEDEGLESTALFQIQDKSYSLKDFFSYALQNQRPKPGISPEYAMELLYDEYVNRSLYEYEIDHLEDKYFDYHMLVREYHDGILLFQLMNEKVWQKATTDTAGLRDYYEKNKANYQWGQRVKATDYSLSNSTLLPKLKAELENGTSPDELNIMFNQQSALALKIDDGLFSKGESSVIDQTPWQVGEHTITEAGRTHYVVIEEVLEPSTKPMNEVRGRLISDYQKHLEEQWITELRNKYKIKVNKSELKSLVKN